MYMFLLYFNAAVITISLVLGAVLKWGKIFGFIDSDESQEKNTKNIVPEKSIKTTNPL